MESAVKSDILAEKTSRRAEKTAQKNRRRRKNRSLFERRIKL